MPAPTNNGEPFLADLKAAIDALTARGIPLDEARGMVFLVLGFGVLHAHGCEIQACYQMAGAAYAAATDLWTQFAGVLPAAGAKDRS